MQNRQFQMSRDHLVLLRRMYVSWQYSEYGAPAIDPKRPYGNSDVATDIRQIFDDNELTDNECQELHEETDTALQIVLATGEFRAGRYECEPYTKNWRLVSEET